MNKKYYWLKLHKDFFRQLEIKKLRILEHGDLYTLIYLKLQLLSITTDGKLFSFGSEDSLAYDLALELDEKVADVEKVLQLLEKYQLLEVLAEDCLLLTKVAGVIGSEGASAERVRRMRQSSQMQVLQCNATVTNSNTEKELELKIDIDKEINESPARINTHPPAYYEDNISLPLESTVDKGCSLPIDSMTAIATCDIIDDLPIDLLAQENFPERVARDADLLGIQAITERLLARLKAEKSIAKTFLTPKPQTNTATNYFEDFFLSYPKSYDRDSTYQVWLKVLTTGISELDLVCAAKEYARQMKNKQTLACYISSSRNFLLSNKFWKFLPTYLANCPHCHGKGNTSLAGEQNNPRCNCSKRYQHLA